MSDAPVLPFHLSIPVSDLDKARAFYRGIVGCGEGRSKDNRIDFNFFGHHIVAHLMPDEAKHKAGLVQAEDCPDQFSVRHFGVIVSMDKWRELADRMVKANVTFQMKPQMRYPGEVREQAILLCEDGCGNVLEFKGQPPERIFATT